MAPPTKILIVRLGAIGDVTNALTFASALKRGLHADSAGAAGLQIGWAVHDEALPLVTGHPAVDRVHHWKRGTSASSILPEIREAGYDAACDLQRLLKSARLARKSGAKRVIGFDRARCKELSHLFTKERLKANASHPSNGPHRVDAYMEFARHMGVADPVPHFELPEHAEAAAWAQARVDEWGGAPILFHLGANKTENRWSPNRFGELARLCSAEFDAPMCHLGGSTDEPLAVRALSMTKQRHGVHSLVGSTKLPQLWELLRRARVLVSADSGPMHLANAVGTPVIGLFGPSDAEVTGPYTGPRADTKTVAHQILSSREGCPVCDKTGGKSSKHSCMEQLQKGTVLEALKKLLS